MLIVYGIHTAIVHRGMMYREWLIRYYVMGRVLLYEETLK